ncbi:hippocampus abundant transcript 1 protein [Pelomyxa schiedti]|nr:hippocampus abundant transcript 1 protein [Pelomyxa schiedti]
MSAGAPRSRSGFSFALQPRCASPCLLKPCNEVQSCGLEKDFVITVTPCDKTSCQVSRESLSPQPVRDTPASNSSKGRGRGPKKRRQGDYIEVDEQLLVLSPRNNPNNLILEDLPVTIAPRAVQVDHASLPKVSVRVVPDELLEDGTILPSLSPPPWLTAAASNHKSPTTNISSPHTEEASVLSETDTISNSATADPGENKLPVLSHDMQHLLKKKTTRPPFELPTFYLKFIQDDDDLYGTVDYDLDSEDECFVETYNKGKLRDMLTMFVVYVSMVLLSMQIRSCIVMDVILQLTKCYGIKYIPQGSWKCRACQATDGGDKSCHFCHKKGGALCRSTTGQWVHMICAISVKATKLIYSPAPLCVFRLVESIDISAVTDKHIRTCSICQKEGICTTCSTKGCHTAFHILCARAAQYKITVTFPRAKVKCPVHSKLKHPPLLKKPPSPSLEEAPRKLALDCGPQISGQTDSGEAFLGVRLKKMQVTLRTVPSQFVETIFKHWIQKRQARKNEPLLKRFEPSIVQIAHKALPGDFHPPNTVENFHKMCNIRRDLETARTLLSLILAREREKRLAVNTLVGVLNCVSLTPLSKQLLTLLETLMSLDPNHLFSVSACKTIQGMKMDWTTFMQNIESNHYTNGQDFYEHFESMCKQALAASHPKSIYHKLAKKLLSRGSELIKKTLEILSDESAFVSTKKPKKKKPASMHPLDRAKRLKAAEQNGVFTSIVRTRTGCTGDASLLRPVLAKLLAKLRTYDSNDFLCSTTSSDLDKISQKLNGLQYSSVDEFKKDFCAICNNAMRSCSGDEAKYAELKLLLQKGITAINKVSKSNDQKNHRGENGENGIEDTGSINPNTAGTVEYDTDIDYGPEFSLEKGECQPPSLVVRLPFSKPQNQPISNPEHEITLGLSQEISSPITCLIDSLSSDASQEKTSVKNLDSDGILSAPLSPSNKLDNVASTPTSFSVVASTFLPTLSKSKSPTMDSPPVKISVKSALVTSSQKLSKATSAPKKVVVVNVLGTSKNDKPTQRNSLSPVQDLELVSTPESHMNSATTNLTDKFPASSNETVKCVETSVPNSTANEEHTLSANNPEQHGGQEEIVNIDNQNLQPPPKRPRIATKNGEQTDQALPTLNDTHNGEEGSFGPDQSESTNNQADGSHSPPLANTPQQLQAPPSPHTIHLNKPPTPPLQQQAALSSTTTSSTSPSPNTSPATVPSPDALTVNDAELSPQPQQHTNSTTTPHSSDPASSYAQGTPDPPTHHDPTDETQPHLPMKRPSWSSRRVRI